MILFVENYFWAKSIICRFLLLIKLFLYNFSLQISDGANFCRIAALVCVAFYVSSEGGVTVNIVKGCLLMQRLLEAPRRAQRIFFLPTRCAYCVCASVLYD